MEGMFLQSVEGLGEAEPYRPSGSELWESLESERQDVANEILSDGPLCNVAISDAHEVEASRESDREIEWRFRSQLEARLRELTEAEDRLRAGAYGHCEECGAEIDKRRLVFDPAVALCIICQRNTEPEHQFCTL